MQGEDEDGAYVQDEGCDCDEDEPEEEVADEHYGCGILSGNRKNLPRGLDSYYFEQTEHKEGKVDEKDGLQQQQQKSWNSMDAAALEALLSQGRNWNEEYQSLMELSPPQPSNELEENERGLHPHNRVPTKKEQERALFELERARCIQSLYREFTQTAERIAVRLIAEQFWGPDQPRTIAPITNQVGGAAGGAKYFAEGIFFKFAVDENGLYGGEDEGIMKVAGHELKSLIACLDRRVAGLHFPLVVLVDFRGRRIIAQSVLPLGKDTIIYGSNNAGKDIHASVKTFNEKMALLAREYHLCGEHISNHSKTQTVKLYSSCDVEGHRGRDGRYYLIDMARYFPPTAPNKSLKGGFLFQLLRPEFMKNYSKALLCPDSYSGFWLQNKKQHNADVVDATKYLAQVIVPGFVEQMAGQLFQHFYPTEEQGRGGETPEKNKDYGDDTKQRRDTDSAKRNTKRSGTKNKIIERDIDERLRKRHFEELVLQLHRNGINMRLLGLIRANIITQMNGEKKWKKEKRKKRKEEKVKVILQKELWDKKKEKRDEAAKSREEKERKQKTLWERKKWRLAFLNQLLTTEMVARTLKQMIKREMRQLCLDEEQRYKEVVAKHFCHLLFVLLQQLTSIAKTSKRTEERILFSTEDVQQEEMYWTRVEVEVERRFSSKATWKEKEQEKNSSKEEENKTAQNHKKANKKKKMKKQSSMAPPKIVDNILMVSLWKRLQTFLGISFCMTEEQLKEEEEQASVTSSTFLFRRMEQRPRGKNRFIFFLLNSFGKQHKNNALKFRHDEAYPFRTVCAGELINAMHMRPKVKHIHRISFEEGTALSKLASSVALSPLQSSRATASSSTFPISTSLSCPRTLLMATELAISAEESLPALRKSDDYFTLAQKQFKEAIARNPSDARSLHNWALSLYLKAASMSGKEADDLYRVSGNKFKAALSIEPYDYQAFFKWGNCLFQRHRIRQHQLRLASTPALVQCCNHESLQLLDRAIARYDRAWQLKRDDYEILFNWANAIYHKASLLLKSKQADASPSAERDLATSREETMISSPNSRQEQLAFLELDEQEDNFVPAKAMKTKSVKLHKEDDETEDCDEDESDSEEDYAAEGVQWRNIVALLKEACSKYEKAHCLQPSSFQVLRNWAVALRLSRNGSKASQLYMEAFEKYKAALLLKSNDYELHFNYGNALFRYVNSLMSSAQAPTTLATQRVQLGVLGLCSEQYHQCLVLNPRCSHALKNWKDVILLKDKVLSILLEKQEKDIKQQLSLLKDELQAYLTLHLRSNKNVEMSFLSLIREFGGENLRLGELQNCFNACIKSLCFVSTSSHPTPAIQSPSLAEASDHKQALQGSTTYGGTTTIMAPNIDALQWRGDTILSPSLHPSLFYASLHI
ncbi:Clu domain-containing protein [Balamuthia mandrillaris]